MGIMSPEYAWWAAIGGFILSAVMMICACCLCDTWLISDTFYLCIMGLFFLLVVCFYSFRKVGHFWKNGLFFVRWCWSSLLRLTTYSQRKKPWPPLAKRTLAPLESAHEARTPRFFPPKSHQTTWEPCRLQRGGFPPCFYPSMFVFLVSTLPPTIFLDIEAWCGNSEVIFILDSVWFLLILSHPINRLTTKINTPRTRETSSLFIFFSPA